MTDLKASSLVEHFAELEDPRIERTKLHQLSDILVIAVCVRSSVERTTGLK